MTEIFSTAETAAQIIDLVFEALTRKGEDKGEVELTLTTPKKDAFKLRFHIYEASHAQFRGTMKGKDVEVKLGETVTVILTDLNPTSQPWIGLLVHPSAAYAVGGIYILVYSTELTFYTVCANM